MIILSPCLRFDRHHRAIGFEDDELGGGTEKDFLGAGFFLDPHKDKVDGIVCSKLDNILPGRQSTYELVNFTGESWPRRHRPP